MIGYHRFRGFGPFSRRHAAMYRLLTVLEQEKTWGWMPFWLECFQHQCRRAVVLQADRFKLDRISETRVWPPATGKVTYQRHLGGVH